MWNQTCNGFTLKWTLFKVTRCKISIFSWILSEITVFPVTCTNTGFIVYVISRKRRKLQQKKHTEHCWTQLNKTACEIRSVFNKVQFWVNNLAPFFHRTLQINGMGWNTNLVNWVSINFTSFIITGIGTHLKNNYSKGF